MLCAHCVQQSEWGGIVGQRNTARAVQRESQLVFRGILGSRGRGSASLGTSRAGEWREASCNCRVLLAVRRSARHVTHWSATGQSTACRRAAAPHHTGQAASTRTTHKSDRQPHMARTWAKHGAEPRKDALPQRTAVTSWPADSLILFHFQYGIASLSWH
jgi:hypothetical protein